jgi:Glycosyl hydrolases family 16
MKPFKTVRSRWIAASAALAIAVAGGVTATTVSAAGTVTLAPTADTYVQVDRPTENFGTSVRFSTEGRANMWRHSLLRFNVPVPAGEKVTSAKLRLYSEAAATATEFVDIYNTTGTWSETGATWANAPARGTWLGKAGGFAHGAWVEFDVTKNIGDGGFVNFKLESNAQKWIGFKSKEATTTAHRPQLVVTTEAGTIPTPTPTPTTPPQTGDGTTAAQTLGWGPVLRGDEFNYTGAPDPAKWTVYGDYAGHAGNGQRLKAQTTVNGSAARISGDVNGNTGGMSAKYDEGIGKYYRLESRMRTSERTPRYHPVMLMWADAVDGGQVITAAPEIDYAEGTADPTKINFYLHWQGSSQTTSASKVLDTTQWHNYAVEWTDKAVIGYVDGVEWFRDTDPAHIPNTPMHSTIQLDWFPQDSATAAPAWMEVDWTREYAVATTPTPTPVPTATSAPPTTPPATGGSWDVAIVGDMNGERTYAPSSESGKNAASIKAALDNGTLDNFLGVGDFQYSAGTCALSSNSSFDYWERLWGGIKSKTYWNAAPNHDYEPVSSDGVPNTDFDNWMNGECVSATKAATNTDPTRQNRNTQNGQPAGFQEAMEWYSVTRGNWHLLSVSSAPWRYDTALANRQTAEIDRNLAEAKAAGKHLAVMLHEPYFGSATSQHARELDSKPWIDVFWKHRVKVLISGSQHNYERTCPVNNLDQCVPDGMQQFQVSTGGIGLRSFTSNLPAHSQKRFTGTWGHLRMNLNDNGSYAWNYVPTGGVMSNTDSGSRQ